MAFTIGECRVLKAPPLGLCDWLGSWFGGEEEKKKPYFSYFTGIVYIVLYLTNSVSSQLPESQVRGKSSHCRRCRLQYLFFSLPRCPRAIYRSSP